MNNPFFRKLIGAPRDVNDPRTYHTISLIALLAWVGLGADGLSSSAYGPDEAFRALGSHSYLAVALVLASTFTILVISVSYSQIIKQFPFGGGGYVVATHLLGPGMGVVSGSALLIDYMLTISVSVTSGVDQVFSILPAHWLSFKVEVAVFVVGILVIMNLRGVKESVTILAPVFVLFLLLHVVLIVGGIGTHLGRIPEITHEVGSGFRNGQASIGWVGMFAVFLKAYSMGAGTYTGIEAVSNGLQIMREPRVQTARRTMVMMAISLAVTAGGILLLYLLFDILPVRGKTMNAVLLHEFAGHWRYGSWNIGFGFIALTLGAEAALLFVAAQAGFIDGPRVMSSMAMDSWFPHRFVQLSDRLTMQNGVLLMGGAAIVTILYTGGDITALVTMYSINVFVTFSLSQLGMLRHWITTRGKGAGKGLMIHGITFVLCASILVGVVYEKFTLGAWVTLVVTSVVVLLCVLIRRHYRHVSLTFKRLDEIIEALPKEGPGNVPPLDAKAPTAVMLVGAYGGLGIHALLTVMRLFPGYFKGFVFVSVGVIDAATMKGVEEVEHLRERTREGLRKYVEVTNRLGFPAEYRMAMGADTLNEATALAKATAAEFPRSVFFLGKLVFQKEKWYHRFLHNETAYALQRRFQFEGMNAMVLPVRVLEIPPANRPGKDLPRSLHLEEVV